MSIITFKSDLIKPRPCRRPRRAKPSRPLPRPAARRNPRDSWPAWTDADRWTPAEAPAPALDLTAFATHQTIVAAPAATYARSTALRPADLREVASFFKGLDDPRPTAVEPTPRSEAWEAGFALGYEHEADAVPSADLPEELSLSWWHGRNVGWLRREHDDLMIDALARPEEVEAPEDRVSDGERLEVMGSAAFPRRNDWD